MMRGHNNGAQRNSYSVQRVLELSVTFAKREFTIRYRRSVLSVLWTVITPVVLLAVYGFILTRSFGVEGKCAPYLSTAWSGLVLWTVFATALTAAASSLLANAHLVTKIGFPLESLPIGSTLSVTADVVVGILSLVILGGVQTSFVGIETLLIVIPFGIVLLYTLALGLIFATVAVRFRDTIHAISLGLRVGFFATPVMYDSSFVPEAFQWSTSVNPVAVGVESVRAILLCDESPDWSLLGIHFLVGSALLGVAMIMIRIASRRIPDEL